MTLGPPAAAPNSRRPHTVGEVSGTKHGVPVDVGIEWLVDTGADVGVVQKSVGDRFDLIPTGASASPTAGRTAILMCRGLTVGFDAEDPSGTLVRRASARDVGVKSADTGSNLIGVDQLADAGVTLGWDPVARSGGLYT